MKFDWLLLLHFHFDGLKKDAMNLEEKIVQFMTNIGPLRANQIARITSDFKMDL